VSSVVSSSCEPLLLTSMLFAVRSWSVVCQMPKKPKEVALFSQPFRCASVCVSITPLTLVSVGATCLHVVGDWSDYAANGPGCQDIEEQNHLAPENHDP
jgi:hypothetical protein